jgi:hypothetical protein
MDTRLTPAEIETAHDLRGLFNEAIAEVQNADDSSLQLEAKLRSNYGPWIDLRVIEVTNHEQRIAALEE